MAHTPPPSRGGPLMTPLSSVKTAPKWTMQGRFRIEKTSNQEAPGPGSYGAADDTISSKFNKPARMVFGSSLRGTMESKNKAPGPGAYKVQDSKLGNDTPSYSCTPRRQGDSRMSKDSPGPGSHTVDTLIGRGTPRWKLGTALRQGEKPPVSPGPAAYAPMDSLDGVPKWSMGTDQRKGMANASDAPGPGSYQLSSRLQEGPKYSVAARRDIPGEKKEAGPGPSAYSLNSTLGNGPKSTMSSRDMWSRKANNSQAENPGPGAYLDSSMDAVKTKGASFGFGTAIREGMGGKKSKAVPGPGNYTPKDPAGEMSKAFGFGSAGRQGMAKSGAGGTIPGPGTYALGDTVGKGSRVIMTPRRAMIEGRSCAPGPGAYRPATAPESAAWGFGTSARPGLSGADASLPAPGTYSHGKALGSDAPKYTMGSRVADRDKEKGGGASGGEPWTQFGY